jgi:proteasome lid subunit RPN8/RPN11
MRVRLPKAVVEQLISELTRAGTAEIGGILMGEHVADGDFKVCEITVQRLGGGFAFFQRAFENVIAPLKRFFEKTGNNFTRFNYLGEWHSHPSFEPCPSSVDVQTMTDIAEDPRFQGNFVALMILRLSKEKLLTGTVTIFSLHHNARQADLIIE